MMKLKELARQLGLSQTTVSRALNGYPEVSEDTRRRVLEAAQRVHYRPNVSARRLATGRAGAVGAVLQTDRNLLLDPHYVEFLAGLGERLAEDEIDIVLSPARGNDEAASYRRIATGAPGRLRDPVEPERRRRAPQPAHATSGCPSSSTAGRAATFRTPGSTSTMRAPFATPPSISSISATARSASSTARPASAMSSIASAASARRSPSATSVPDERLIGYGAMTDEVGFRLAQRFLAERPRPTALLAASMMMALGAFRAMRAAGLELGRDVSMIAHDDVFPFLNADRMVPPMSTTRSSIRAAGTRVAELAVELLAGRAPETIHELWPVDLVIRGSTGPAPKE